ncbi:hypothetical protein PV11_06977 [Exophiala sideris]|uniref:Uncharacterized protein n=1 Tax=Exophiala sideris TaxID=1016849 RepID=A0A0D1VTF1_9EURO|nr:hypothetical protein PV11_06977 [Exophiala sideris]
MSGLHLDLESGNSLELESVNSSLDLESGNSLELESVNSSLDLESGNSLELESVKSSLDLESVDSQDLESGNPLDLESGNSSLDLENVNTEDLLLDLESVNSERIAIAPENLQRTTAVVVLERAWLLLWFGIPTIAAVLDFFTREELCVQRRGSQVLMGIFAGTTWYTWNFLVLPFAINRCTKDPALREVLKRIVSVLWSFAFFTFYTHVLETPRLHATAGRCSKS